MAVSYTHLDVYKRQAVDNSSIAVDGEEQSRNRPGVNVLVYDKVLDLSLIHI